MVYCYLQLFYKNLCIKQELEIVIIKVSFVDDNCASSLVALKGSEQIDLILLAIHSAITNQLKSITLSISINSAKVNCHVCNLHK